MWSRTDVRTYGRTYGRTDEIWKASCRPPLLGPAKISMRKIIKSSCVCLCAHLFSSGRSPHTATISQEATLPGQDSYIQLKRVTDSTKQSQIVLAGPLTTGTLSQEATLPGQDSYTTDPPCYYLRANQRPAMLIRYTKTQMTNQSHNELDLSSYCQIC